MAFVYENDGKYNPRFSHYAVFESLCVYHQWRVVELLEKCYGADLPEFCRKRVKEMCAISVKIGYEKCKRFFEKYELVDDTEDFLDAFDKYMESKSEENLDSLDDQASEMLLLSSMMVSREWLTEEEAAEFETCVFCLLFSIPEWVASSLALKKNH